MCGWRNLGDGSVRRGVVAMSVEFRLLGDVQAQINDQPLELGHARQRNVLAVLLVEVNRVVANDQIIDRVWAEHAPQRSREVLYNYVSRLRRALAATDVVVARRFGGYVL